MSVDLEVNERLRKARACLSKAYNELNIVLNENTQGHENLTSQHLEEIQQVSIELIKLRKRI